jgi:hypothetical protein
MVGEGEFLFLPLVSLHGDFDLFGGFECGGGGFELLKVLVVFLLWGMGFGGVGWFFLLWLWSFWGLHRMTVCVVVPVVLHRMVIRGCLVVDFCWVWLVLVAQDGFW